MCYLSSLCEIGKGKRLAALFGLFSQLAKQRVNFSMGMLLHNEK